LGLTNISTDHPVWSNKCQVYERILSKKKKTINYYSWQTPPKNTCYKNASDIIFLNSQSLISNYDVIKNIIVQKKPVLVCLSETRTTAEIDDNEIYMYGYTTIRNDSQTRHTGGLVIYLLDSIKFKVMNSSFFDGIWILSIKIPKNSWIEYGVYTVVYRSPSGSKKTFLDYCETFFEDIADGMNRHIIEGDFNIDVNKNTYESNRLKHMIESNGMKQLVQDFTRVDQHHRTIIDLIISNDFSLDVDVLHSPKITDHSIVKIKTKQNTKTDEKINITVWTHYDKSAMIEKLNEYDWNK
jgi:hypothetical protein